MAGPAIARHRVPVTRLAPSIRIANRVLANKLARRFLLARLHNDDETLLAYMRDEIALHLDYAGRRLQVRP
jgi:hypothetical protein